MRGAPAETSRLSFRELTIDDLDFVAAMLGDPEVMRFYPHPLDREEARGWIHRMIGRYVRDGHGLWLLSLRGSGVPIGQVGLIKQYVHGLPEPEVGYLLHRPYWKHGYAREAAAAVHAHAFGTLDHDHVISLIRPCNVPSLDLALSLGMVTRGHVGHGGFDHYVLRRERPTSAERDGERSSRRESSTG